jgi:HSP20 family protein
MNPQSHFDVLFRNVFDSHSDFNILPDVKSPHPVDIYEHSEGLVLEIACTGLTKDDIKVDIEDDILKISYDKPEEDLHPGTIHRSLSKKSFNLGYKISSKYDLSKSDGKLENGLLEIFIPITEKAKSSVLKIK